MDELLRDFLTESAEQLEAIGAQLVLFEQDPSDRRIIANIFRLVHAIKGACGFLNLPRLEKMAHAAETLIGRMRDSATPDGAAVPLVLVAVDRIRAILSGVSEEYGEPPGDDSDNIARIAAPNAASSETAPAESGAWDNSLIPGPTPPERRVDTARVSLRALDRINALASELVLARNQIADIERTTPLESIRGPLQKLSAVSADLQSAILATRMQPIERILIAQHRLVRDLAAVLGKRIDLVMRGGDTVLDRQLIEAVRDPLTQLIRNAADHGVESPDERRRAGKPEQGTIEITARHHAGQVVIEVADDGRGLDTAAIRERAFALALGSRDELAELTETDLCRFVFLPGFSTANRLSMTSGRGVGLDIVRANIEKMGGSISLASRRGQGAKIAIRVPLTLAVVPALIVRAGDDRFAVPQHAIEELVECDPAAGRALEDLHGALVFRTTREVMPAARLSDLALAQRPGAASQGAGLALRLRAGHGSFAILVDEIVDVQEIVLKTLPKRLQHLKMYCGASILGDGSIVLALDAQGLAAEIGLPRTSAKVAPAPDVPSAEKSSKYVVFSVGGVRRALPLYAVAGIKRVRAEDYFTAEGLAAIMIGDRLAPLARVEQAAPSPAASMPNYALIVEEGDKRIAIAADAIVDIVEEDVTIDAAGDRAGSLGVASIAGVMTEVVDAFHFVDRFAAEAADRRKFSRPQEILIFEGESFFREFLRGMATAEGLAAICLTDLGEAPDAVATGKTFDVVFCDLADALSRSADVREQLAGVRRTKGSAVVALAAHGGRDIQNAARRAGFAAAVGKFDRAAIRAWLRGEARPEEFGAAA